MAQEKKKKHYQKSWNLLPVCLVLTVSQELLFRLLVFPETQASMCYPLLFAALTGFGLYVLLGCFKPLLSRILFHFAAAGIWAYFAVQFLYHEVFQVFFSFASVTAVGGDVLEFKKQIGHAINTNVWQLVLMLLPVLSLLLFCIRFVEFKQRPVKKQLVMCGIWLFCFGCIRFLLLPLGGKEDFSAYDLYEKNWVTEFGAERLGIFVMAKEDVRSLVFRSSKKENDAIVVVTRPYGNTAEATQKGTSQRETMETAQKGTSQGEMPETAQKGTSQGETLETAQKGTSQGKTQETAQNGTSQGETPETAQNGTPQGETSETSPAESAVAGKLPSPTGTLAADVTQNQPSSQPPVPSQSPTALPSAGWNTVPNILDFDFEALAETENNDAIRQLHRYFAEEEVTQKNEYTGMFQGFNLIFLTAEGFAPYAMVDGLTPTLNKMASEGFVFENYYAPIWETSTSDGEFINCTGLLPDGFHSLKRMAAHDMRFCLGAMFTASGYSAHAYHNHTYTYYSRNKTHPAMGYDYKGRGSGLAVDNVWPASDLQMMELSVPEYIGDEPFHTYYMTVSGHMEYTFHDNRQAYNNRAVVEGLPYSDNAKAYIACNYELEKALSYLVGQLYETGAAERTVIALACDHYPYGLEKQYIDELAGHPVEENFELYESTLIIWSPAMKKPVKVEKYCSALDIVPTLMNLFGMEYDSRLYMGKDILSSNEGLVIFNNRSFITDRVMYDSRTGDVINLTGEVLPEGYIAAMKQVVKNRFAVSKQIIDLDYYKYLPKKPSD